MFEQKITAREIITSPVYTVQPTGRVKRFIAVLCAYRIGRLPGVDRKSDSPGLPRDTQDGKDISKRRPGEEAGSVKKGGPVRSARGEPDYKGKRLTVDS